MSDCSGSGAGMKSTGITRRRPEDGLSTVDDQQLDNQLENEQLEKHTHHKTDEIVNSAEDDREGEDDDDDDDDVQMTLSTVETTTPSAHPPSSATNSIIGSTTMTTTSASASNGIKTTMTKSTSDRNDIDADCDDTAAKDKEVNYYFESISVSLLNS